MLIMTFIFLVPTDDLDYEDPGFEEGEFSDRVSLKKRHNSFLGKNFIHV